jgi:hypothetical protein
MDCTVTRLGLAFASARKFCIITAFSVMGPYVLPGGVPPYVMSPGCGRIRLVSGVSYLTEPLDWIDVSVAASEMGTNKMAMMVRRSSVFFSIRLTGCLLVSDFLAVSECILS